MLRDLKWFLKDLSPAEALFAGLLVAMLLTIMFGL